MHRIARDDMARHVEFFQQFLHGRDFVGFFVDVDMRQHQRRVDGERAEHLFCLGVVEAIETAFERLAIKRDNSRAGTRRVNVQVKIRLCPLLSESGDHTLPSHARSATRTGLRRQSTSD
jgi:hypothetical protein